MTANSVITIKEARKLLGANSKYYSDEDIRLLVLQLEGIAEAFIKSVPNIELERYNEK